MQQIADKIRALEKLLGRGVIWAYVFAVLPCVLLFMDMVNTSMHGQSIALQLFMLTLFGPVAATAIYITWYKIRHKNEKPPK